MMINFCKTPLYSCPAFSSNFPGLIPYVLVIPVHYKLYYVLSQTIIKVNKHQVQIINIMGIYLFHLLSPFE